MKKLVIVSNYNEACGIASYTGSIFNGFKQLENYNVKVAPINTKLMRSNFKGSKKAKREHFIDISKVIENADLVNIQFENGIFGNSHDEVISNLELLFKSNGNIAITMHTADFAESSLSGVTGIKKAVSSGSLKNVIISIYKTMNTDFMERFVQLLKKYKNVKVIVHTNREKERFKLYYGIENVYSYPLVFLPKKVATNYRENVNRNKFKSKYKLDVDDKVIALYGFISPYKGHLSAIKSLRYLPSEYKLLIVGSQHPQSIERFTEIDNYQSNMLDEITGFGNDELEDISERVKFLGSLSDDDMIEVMVNSEVSLFPYLETGQSASGPASICLEVGGNVIFSKSHVFNELERFATTAGGFSRFDIGNYLEIAERIKGFSELEGYSNNHFNEEYSLETNISFYENVFSEAIK